MWVRRPSHTGLSCPSLLLRIQPSAQRARDGLNQRRGVCVHSETQVSPPATPPSAAPPKRSGKALTALTHPPVLTPSLDVTPQQHSVPPPARSARRGAVGVAQGGHQRAGPQPPPQPPSASHSADSAREGRGRGRRRGGFCPAALEPAFLGGAGRRTTQAQQTRRPRQRAAPRLRVRVQSSLGLLALPL